MQLVETFPAFQDAYTLDGEREAVWLVRRCSPANTRKSSQPSISSRRHSSFSLPSSTPLPLPRQHLPSHFPRWTVSPSSPITCCPVSLVSRSRVICTQLTLDFHHEQLSSSTSPSSTRAPVPTPASFPRPSPPPPSSPRPPPLVFAPQPYLHARKSSSVRRSNRLLLARNGWRA